MATIDPRQCSGRAAFEYALAHLAGGIDPRRASFDRSFCDGQTWRFFTATDQALGSVRIADIPAPQTQGRKQVSASKRTSLVTQTLQELVKAAKDAHARLDAIERQTAHQTRGYQTKVMGADKPRYRYNGQDWALSDAGRAEGARAARAMGAKVRWDKGTQSWCRA